MKATRTWIVIADGSHARILENNGPKTGLRQVMKTNYEPARAHARDLTDGERGRVFQSVGSLRSALELTDPKEREKENFSKLISDYLDENKALFDRLVLVAGPQMLGRLRHDLSAQVSERLYAELAKDLTPISTNDIPTHLEDIMVIGTERPDFSVQFVDAKP